MSGDYSKKYIQIFKNGAYAYETVEELISKGFNHTKGWKCSAGINNLYIDYDGNVFVCNNASSKLDRFDHEGWAKKIAEINEKEGTDITSEENIENGTFKKQLRKFNRSGVAFGKVLDNENKENFKKHWGFLGNIAQGFELNDEPVTCPYQTCGCGADIPVAKASDLATLNQITNNDIVEDMDHEANGSIEAVDAMRVTTWPNPSVLWDLGRRCNYDCSYCWPAVHNARDPHKDIEILKSTCDKIMTKLAPGHKKVFCFSGGEPTLHPDIVELVKHIHESGHIVLMTTNGSMKNEKWREVAKYIHILQMSAHFEFLNHERFLKNFETYLELSKERKWGSVDVKLMTPPGGLDVSKGLDEKVKTLMESPKFEGVRKFSHIKCSFVPLRGIDDSEQILEYTEDELNFFADQC